jgi:hypothetical protein
MDFSGPTMASIQVDIDDLGAVFDLLFGHATAASNSPDRLSFENFGEPSDVRALRQY